MLFVVVAEVFEYRPKRCTLLVYKKGDRGCLPDAVVLAAAERGEVEVLGNV